MNTVHILMGGPTRIIIDGAGKKWLFEDHPHCGPIVLDKKETPLENQPPESSSFWPAVQHWYDQGKRTHPPLNGETWCIWERPTIQKMRHLGGGHYVLALNETPNNQPNSPPSGKP